jgi:hypothetical protein
MDDRLFDAFPALWNRFFPGADLPLALYYTGDESGPPLVLPGSMHRCLVADLNRVRAGVDLRFGAASIGCTGGRRYSGFSQTLRPDFRHFLSCGIPGRLEGERYKKTPGIVDEYLARMPVFEAPRPFLVFKRWDRLARSETPDAVVFYATPDVLSGLFTLAGFGDARPDSVIAPFGAGCSSIVQYPIQEGASDAPRAVIGGFDPSARPFIPHGTVTFAVPMSLFARMVEDMEDSFLGTPTWDKVRRRIERAGSAADEPEAPASQA